VVPAPLRFDATSKPFCRLAGFVKNVRVELKEQPFAPTLAHGPSGVPHVSGLLRRIAQVSLCLLDFHFKEVNKRFKNAGL
jgi:hypothetical protein